MAFEILHENSHTFIISILDVRFELYKWNEITESNLQNLCTESSKPWNSKIDKTPDKFNILK